MSDGCVVPPPLDRYFDGLDDGDDDTAASAFADDALYIRPAVGRAGGGFEVLHGRAEIRSFFDRRRAQQQQGAYTHRHDIRSAVLDGSECFVEGLMVGDEGTVGVFLSHAILGGDGLIRRYITAFQPTPDGFAEVPD